MAVRGLLGPAVVLAVALPGTWGCSLLVDLDDPPLCHARPGEPDPCPEGTVCREGRCQPCDPAGPEVCDNGRDDDCDGLVDEGQDLDGDGFATCAATAASPVDCDDSRSGARPGGVERCDAVDGDCDGVADDDAPCGEGLACVDGRCEAPGECRAPGACPEPLVCGADGAGGFACREGPRCTGDGDCAPAVCDGSSGRCVEGGGAPGSPCAFDAACTAPGTCDPAPRGSSEPARSCQLACRTDGDCAADEVCWATEDGGRTCLSASAVGLVLGPVPGGGRCETGADCRSGVCGEKSECLVRCTSNLDCLEVLDAGACRLAPDASLGVAGRCVRDVGGGGIGDPCTGSTDCGVGACPAPAGGSGRCAALCGTQAECDGAGVCATADVPAGRLLWRVAVCRPPAGPGPGAPLGAACSADQGCASFVCFAGACRARCGREADCDVEGEGGEVEDLGRCRPRVTADGRTLACLPDPPER